LKQTDATAERSRGVWGCNPQRIGPVNQFTIEVSITELITELESMIKTKLHSLFILLALTAGVHQAAAQLPVITSFSQNGLLVCSNLATGSVASVEWASSLSGPWHTNWAGLDAVTVASNSMIQVSVPMFYRVRGVAQVTNSAPTGTALIPAGSFTMGDTLDGESDAIPITVTVSKFYMDTNLVSYSQWQSVYSWATSHGYGFVNAGSGKAASHPVQTVDWYDAVKWCNARSQQAGLNPVYYTDAGLTQVYTNGEVTVYVNWAVNGYRLPTEAEWEKAARGGLSGQRFPWGNTISESQANYYGETGTWSYDLGPNGYNAAFATGANPYTSPVGYFGPNGYGLYDMAGNVFEWCWDWYGTPYAGGSDPRGPASGSYRVLRGGVWDYYAVSARCAYRGSSAPSDADYNFGFRCVRGL
jgi:formylglycine-generating enzyme